MAVVEIFEVILAIVSVTWIIVQVVIPLWSGKPIFPMFRRRNRELTKVREEREDFSTQREIIREKEGLEEDKQKEKRRQAKKPARR